MKESWRHGWWCRPMGCVWNV